MPGLPYSLGLESPIVNSEGTDVCNQFGRVPNRLGSQSWRIYLGLAFFPAELTCLGGYPVRLGSNGSTREMEINEAKSFENKLVELSWSDRTGKQISDKVQVFSVGFVPLYGPCLQTSHGDIRLDRIAGCTTISERQAS